jgi:predicted nucleic acid-binding protein
MPVKPFFDTNILIYAFAASDPKAAIAQRLLAAGGLISVQSLNEFANVSRRKLGLDWAAIEERIAHLRVLLDRPLSITAEVHDAARQLASEHMLGLYDALVVASALSANASELLTEDLQHGRKFGAMTIRNPFIAA